jgi:hypothetical protein
MQYLLLIFDDPAELERATSEERARIFPDYRTFTEDIQRSGHFRAGDPLEPVTTATTVRIRGGKRLITDGPFAETKEHMVGYYLVEADDLDTALAIAARIPSARFGAVEVRPIRTFTR